MLNNKLMSEKLDIPLTKVRRWAKEFLPPDPRATRRSGYAREFSFNDGFYLFLGGTMVSEFGWTFTEARAALALIWPWLLDHGMVPDIPKTAQRRGIDAEVDKYTALIFHCHARTREISAVEVFGIGSRNEKTATDSTGKRYTRTQVDEIRYFIHGDAEGVVFKILNIWPIFSNFLLGLEQSIFFFTGWKVKFRETAKI